MQQLLGGFDSAQALVWNLLDYLGLSKFYFRCCIHFAFFCFFLGGVGAGGWLGAGGGRGMVERGGGGGWGVGVEVPVSKREPT